MSLRDEICIATGIGLSEFARIENSAPVRYKSFSIAKKSGDYRIIAQPSRELKIIQRWICENYLASFPVHNAAYAYRLGRGISHNARVHAGSRYILKIDFKDFFHSITPNDLFVRIKLANKDLSKADKRTLSQCLFWGKGVNMPLCLSIGAPSSPMLSNIVMFDFDERIARICKDKGVKYTRYADDITVSSEGIDELLFVERGIRETVKNSKNPKIEINEDKSRRFGPGQRKLVTGLNLTSEGGVSIGRGRKRKIHSMMNSAKYGILPDHDIGMLKGLIAFSISCDDDLVTLLRKKYGSDVVDRILSFKVPSRRR
ncbi:retron St85 family RNA-directed DNA polymerase [Aureimonas phyllosphaerae]|uniref:RNA-directed DNA polymerase n=1 Tax=Aureimonas phyllosphaerae TaxID=1166078 RepID=A0A7W6BPM4_9HYPH|nr:retron St85 family RNA-directed DNA polymerase [Aureimonas phyllosphaerae]MBB3935779.1 retron-type reverse transcriptase [Aureimonas phyllosphaerae]MBB3959787.1 retron-type reverse transcriptase [Aureimonas phyllosphaerae]SFF15011.1 RNA-directed DNA polymerase [Aureimonas phyllosphaerae]